MLPERSGAVIPCIGELSLGRPHRGHQQLDCRGSAAVNSEMERRPSGSKQNEIALASDLFILIFHESH